MSLKRVLGPIDAGWLVAGNMIGAGIFYTPGLVAGHLPGGVWPLVAWALGGALALCGAAVYAELGSRIPRPGGDYQYLVAAFGPLWGFLTGWAGMLLTFTAAAAAMSIVAADYLVTALPAIGVVPVRLLAPGLVLTLTAANAVGSRVAGKTTAWLTALPLTGLAVLFVTGLASGDGEVRWPAATALPETGILALGAALLPVFFTYSGWNAAAYLAGEMRDPGRDLWRGLLGGTAAVTCVYLAINAVLLAVVPQATLAGSTAAGSEAARLLLGPAAERALALCIAMSVIGSVNVTLMAGSRIYYAMAVDGLAPRALARTGSAGVPGVALWVAGVWGALLSSTDRVEVLVNWSALAMLLLSSMVVVALFRLRRRGGPEPAYRCTGYPVTPVLYLVVSLAVAGASVATYPRQSLYGVLIVAAGWPVYRVFRRRGAVTPSR